MPDPDLCKHYRGPGHKCGAGLMPSAVFGKMGEGWKHRGPCRCGNEGTAFEPCAMYQVKQPADWDNDREMMAGVVEALGVEPFIESLRTTFGVPASGCVLCPKCGADFNFRFNTDGRFMGRCKQLCIQVNQ